MPKFAGSLDANVLLRLMLNDIPEQHAAAAKLVQSTHRQFLVADTAIIQLVFALEKHYHFKRPAVQETVEALLSIPNITSNRSLFTEVLGLFVKNGNLSFEDCYIYTYAGAHAATPLWTFDKKLAARADSARLVAPGDIPMSYEMT